MSERGPAEVFSPGEFLKEELEERGWSQADLADILGKSTRLVNEIVQGKRSITPETAQGLGDAFGTSAEYWLRLENAYQLGKVSRSDEVTRRARLFALAPIKDMVRRGWLVPSNSTAVLEARVLDFLERQSLEEEEDPLPHAARKSAPYSQLNPAQRAWLLRVRKLARALPSRRHTEQLFTAALEQLRPLRLHQQEVRHVPRILGECGVRFLIVEHLPHSKIDGVCLWLDKWSPVIALSLRYDRIDYFWHTLMHEMGHVQRHDGLAGEPTIDVDIVGEGLDAGRQRPDSEVTADAFASDFLVPKHELDGFIARVGPLYSKEKIAGFSARLGVHPGIVVGQLQHRREITYAHSREALTKVRDIVTDSSLTDGWGHYTPTST